MQIVQKSIKIPNRVSPTRFFSFLSWITWTYSKQIPSPFSMIGNVIDKKIVLFNTPWPSSKFIIFFTVTNDTLWRSRHGKSHWSKLKTPCIYMQRRAIMSMQISLHQIYKYTWFESSIQCNIFFVDFVNVNNMNFVDFSVDRKKLLLLLQIPYHGFYILFMVSAPWNSKRWTCSLFSILPHF